MDSARVVLDWKYWVFFFSMGGKGGGGINFHSSRARREKVMCWGVQIGEEARMQCGAWLLVISKLSFCVQCWPLRMLIKFCFLPKPHHLQLMKQ